MPRKVWICQKKPTGDVDVKVDDEVAIMWTQKRGRRITVGLKKLPLSTFTLTMGEKEFKRCFVLKSAEDEDR